MTAVLPVTSDPHLANEIAGWMDPTKTWAGKPAKVPMVVAPFSPSGAIRTRGVDILRDLGLVTTVWDTGRMMVPAAGWAVLRYALAFDVAGDGQLCLSPEANALRYHHRQAMSEYLGIGVGMQVVRAILEQRHPGVAAYFVDAEFILSSGSKYPGFSSAPHNKLRPDYFVFVRNKPVYVFECKAAGSTTSRTISLAKATRQLHSVQYYGSTPRGVCTHALLRESGISCTVFDTEGDDEWNAPAAWGTDRASRSRPVLPEGEHESVVNDVGLLRAELEDVSQAALLDWSGAARSAYRLIPPRLAEERGRQLPEADAPTTLVTIKGFEFAGVEATFPYAGRLLRVFRGIDASTRERLMTVASTDDPSGSGFVLSEVEDRFNVETRNRLTDGDAGEAIAVGGDGSILRLRIEYPRGA